MPHVASPNTGASLETLSPDDLRKLWRRKVDVHEQEEDPFSEHEGARADSLIETVTDTSVGAGHRIRFTAMAGFYQEGRHGDEDFSDPEDYEKVEINGNDLLVDYIRNGVRWNQRMEDHMGLKHELAIKFPDELGKWIGRKKGRAGQMKLIRGGTDRNLAVAGGGSDIHALGGANGLTYNDVVEVGTLLKGHGAGAARLGKVKNQPIRRYVVLGSQIHMLSLKKDDQYLEALNEAGIDGTANELFTGGFADVDGHMMREYQIVDHDGDGPLGNPSAPKLKINAAINSPTAPLTVTGGRVGKAPNPKVFYTQDFPNHAFKFNASDVLSTGTDPFYLLIVNPNNAPTDPGKMGFYKCVGNTGRAITITEALSGATPGAFLKATIGEVTWDTGVWAGKHTTVHPAGAMAYLANAKGQPYGYTFMLGACAMRRGYGEFRNARANDSKEGKFIRETYGITVFGQSLKMNVDEEFPNHMVIAHALHYPGTPIPQNIV